MRLIFLCGLAALPLSAAEATPEWKLPEAEAQRWAERIKTLYRMWPWTVTVRGNDLILQRDAPMMIYRMPINAPPGGQPRGPGREGVYRLTLRFGPALSMEGYEQLVAENKALDLQVDALVRKHGGSQRFFEIYFFNDPDRKRENAYLEERAKLPPYHVLPSFYAPGYRITFLRSWRWFEYPESDSQAVNKECREVEANLMKYFGTYDAWVAIGNSTYGESEPEPIK